MPLSWVYIISGLKGPQNCQHGRSSGNVFLWTLNEYKTGEKQQSLNPFNPETKPFQSSSRERTQSILLTTAPLPYSVSPVRACGVREPWGCFNLGLCFSWEHEGKWKKPSICLEKKHDPHAVLPRGESSGPAWNPSPWLINMCVCRRHCHTWVSKGDHWLSGPLRFSSLILNSR